MSKLSVYVGILATVIIGFNLVGIIQNTGTSALLSWISDPSSWNNLDFYTQLKGVLTALSVAGIIVGFFRSDISDKVASSAAALLFLSVGEDIVRIYNEITKWNPEIALLIFSPILLVYLITVVEWWRGMN